MEERKQTTAIPDSNLNRGMRASDESRALTQWLGARAVEELTARLQNHLSRAALLQIRKCEPELSSLSFLQRRDYLAAQLGNVLPKRFEDGLKVVMEILPAPREQPGYGGWSNSWILVCSRYISLFGLAKPRLALNGLKIVTRTFTSEFDVRPFFQTHPSLTLQTAEAWTSHTCQHVRRLAIESLRPRLPWACRIKEFEKDPAPVLQLCSRLVDDNSKYVLRSVANCIADVYKKHPARAIQTLRSYSNNSSSARRWVAKHALRYPARKGDERASDVLNAIYHYA